MAKIFLDANIFIDLIENRGEITIEDLNGHELFISPLSLHILIYITKQGLPFAKLTKIIKLFSIVEFDRSICYKSLDGPTNDFEDNVQLHSAAHAECDYFLTEDRKLASLKFFGKTQIVSNLASKD